MLDKFNQLYAKLILESQEIKNSSKQENNEEIDEDSSYYGKKRDFEDELFRAGFTYRNGKMTAPTAKGHSKDPNETSRENYSGSLDQYGNPIDLSKPTVNEQSIPKYNPDDNPGEDWYEEQLIREPEREAQYKKEMDELDKVESKELRDAAETNRIRSLWRKCWKDPDFAATLTPEDRKKITEYEIELERKADAKRHR